MAKPKAVVASTETEYVQDEARALARQWRGLADDEGTVYAQRRLHAEVPARAARLEIDEPVFRAAVADAIMAYAVTP